MADDLEQGAAGGVKDFNYDIPSGADIEADSSGVGLRAEDEDGLSPVADRPIGDTTSAPPADRPSRRRAERPALRSEATDGPVVDENDEEEDEGLDRPAARTADGEREPRSVRRGMERRHEKLQRRIADATRQLRETERRIEERERVAGRQPAPAARTEGQAAPAERPKRPRMPKWSEFEKTGKTWDDFEVAQTKYETDLDQYDEAVTTYLRGTATKTADDRLESDRATAAQQRAHQAHLSRVEKFRTEHEDWQDIEASLDGLDSKFLHDAIYFHDKGDEILAWCGQNRDLADDLVDCTLTNAMMAALRSSEQPVALLQHLAENTAETERIARLPYSPALKALGALEARLEGAAAGSDDRPSGSSRGARRQPAAPPPSQRAGQRSGAPARDPNSEGVDDYVSRRFREERDRKLRSFGLRSA